MQIDARFGQGDTDRIRKYATEMVAFGPDVILATGSAATEHLIKTTRTVPIVFAVVPLQFRMTSPEARPYAFASL